MVWAALGAPARSWRSLGEEERNFFHPLSHGRDAFYFAGREWLFYGEIPELSAEGNCRGHHGGGPRRPSDAAEQSNAKMTIFFQMSLG